MLIAKRSDERPTEESRPSISWEESGCPVCLGRYWSPLLETQDQYGGADGLWFAIVQCDSCGACFTNPRPDPVSLAPFWTHDDASRQMHHLPRWLPARHTAKWPLAWHGQGRLLDIGCGTGDYLLQMHRRGWTVTGVDPSSQAVEHIRSELGLTAHSGILSQIDLEPESFDLITMWHAIEHVHEPLPLLREVRRLLVPGGKLVATTPNIDSWAFRWFGRHWAGLDVPRRLTHFTPASLTQMLQRAGLVTEPIRPVYRSDWLRESAAIAARQIRPVLWQKLLSFRLAASLAAWVCFAADQSDCMLAVAYR